MSSVHEESDGQTRVTRRSMRRMNSSESLTDLESRSDTPTQRLRNTKKLDTISEKALPLKKSTVHVDSPAPLRTRKASLSESIDLTASPLRRTTRAMSNERDMTSSPVPMKSNRRSAMIESEDDSTVDLTTPGRKPRKSIRKSTAIDLIKEEPEEETASEFNDSKEMNQTVIDELELRTRSISKSPSTSLSPQKTSVIEKSSQNSAINFSALEDDEEEKVEKPGKFFKNRSQFSKNQTSDDKKMSFNDGSDEIEKFVSNGNSRSSEKTTFEGVIERMQDNVVERDVRDALLSPSKLFRGRRSIHGEKSDDEVDKMLEDFVADDDILQAGGKTPKSARKILKNIEETPLSVGKLSELIATPKSIAKTPKSSEKVLKMSETPKSVKKISENATEAVQSSPLITGTPKSASKTPKLSESLKSAEKVMEMLKTPKSASKVSRSVDTTPKAAENSPAAIKTPKSVKKTPESDVSIPETPMSASKVIGTPNGTPKSDKFSVTPKSAQKSDKISQNTPKSAVKTTLDTIKTPKGKDTPKSAKKTDSPKNHNETSLNNDKMDITAKSSDMEISPSSPSKNKISRISPVKTDHKSVNIETMQRRTWSQSVSNGKQDSPVHRHSFSEYLENISKSSEKRKSMPKEPVEVISTERSWTHSVRKSREGAIDAAQVDTAPEVIKASPRKSKPISSDESDDDHEKNKFVDDEAEVGSEGESITESERNYLKEHEIPEQGELIGSEDSDEIDDEEEDDDESDSFIDNEVLSDSYDMDSEEERIESSQEKRKSRIIAPSSSEDEEQVEEQLKGSAKKNHKKAEAKHQEIQEADENVENQVESEKEEIAEELPKSKKRKRDSIINESIIETKKKRAKLNSSANGSEAMHMEDLSEKMEVSEPEPRKEKLKKVKKDLFEPKNIVSVIEKCDAFMSAHQKEKKQKMSLKREKRAQKLAKKLEEKRAENMDSSNGENKENAPKKKKKKAKKQKLVEDMPEQKEDMATSVAKLQEKLERKKQRKAEKKQAKLLKLQSEPQVTTETEVLKKSQSEPAAKPEKPGKRLKKSKSEQLLAQPELIVVKEKVKKSKKSVEPAPEQVVEVAKTHKKRAAEPVIEVAPPTSSEPKKKKKKKSEPIAEVVEEVPEKKKSKKRKLDESIEEMKPKPKKLNILAQIEDPHHSNRNLPSRQESSKGAAEQPFSVPLASQKIKKIIPEVAKVDKKKRKKSTQRVIPEPENSLPRPIWTSAGIFIEEPISPFKFTSTKYVPISSNSSTKFGVVAFDAKKKKPQQMQAPHLSGDFKTQAMLRNKNRDGSSKNIRGLLGVRNTF